MGCTFFGLVVFCSKVYIVSPCIARSHGQLHIHCNSSRDRSLIWQAAALFGKRLLFHHAVAAPEAGVAATVKTGTTGSWLYLYGEIDGQSSNFYWIHSMLYEKSYLLID
jgi:hypothetical protein